MHVTSKSRYAIKVVLDLCSHGNGKQIDVETIVRRQKLSKDYVSQILHRLRQADLVSSVRGRGGGYILAKLPAKISVWDIMVAVEDFMEPVKCLGASHGCNLEPECIAKDAWSEIYSRMKRELSSLTLSELLPQERLKSVNTETATNAIQPSGTVKLKSKIKVSVPEVSLN